MLPRDPKPKAKGLSPAKPIQPPAGKYSLAVFRPAEVSSRARIAASGPSKGFKSKAARNVSWRGMDKVTPSDPWYHFLRPQAPGRNLWFPWLAA